MIPLDQLYMVTGVVTKAGGFFVFYFRLPPLVPRPRPVLGERVHDNLFDVALGTILALENANTCAPQPICRSHHLDRLMVPPQTTCGRECSAHTCFLHPLGGTDAVAPFHTTRLDMQQKSCNKKSCAEGPADHARRPCLRGAAITGHPSSKSVLLPSRFLKWGAHNRKGVPWPPQEERGEGETCPKTRTLSSVLKVEQTSGFCDHPCSVSRTTPLLG